MPATAPRPGSVRAGGDASPKRMPQETDISAPGTVAPGAAARIRLRVGGLRLAAEEIAALLPDFRIERGPGPAAEIPFALLDEGLLRGAPYGRTAPRLSAVALTVAGPPSPADRLDPTVVLAERGWEIPELIHRAQAARRALVASRVGGAWWLADDGELMAHEEYALVLVAEPPVAGSETAPAEGALAAMLDAALAENPPERVVILAPTVPRPLD